MSLFWLSFCDPEKPKGEQFAGVALVEIADVPEQDERGRIAAAIRRAWSTGCNPGGEVACYELPLDVMPNEKRLLLAKAPKHTLMDKAALGEYGLL